MLFLNAGAAWLSLARTRNFAGGLRRRPERRGGVIGQQSVPVACGCGDGSSECVNAPVGGTDAVALPS